MSLDPKITLHGDKVSAGSVIRQARILLYEQMRKDISFGNSVSKVRYVLPTGQAVVATHEYARTYLDISAPRPPSPLTVRTPPIPPAYVALSGHTQASTPPFTTTLWLSSNGVSWRKGPPVPHLWAVSGLNAIPLPAMRFLLGSWDAESSLWALYLMDAATGVILNTWTFPASIQGAAVVGAPALVYLGDGKVWMAVYTSAAVWSATFDTAFGDSPFTLGQQLFPTSLDAMTYFPQIVQGAKRPGEKYADVFIVSAAPVAGVSGVIFQASSLDTPPQAFVLPPFTMTSDLSLLVGAGPPSGLLATVQGLNSAQTGYQVQAFVATDLYGPSPNWSGAITVAGKDGSNNGLGGTAHGYHPKAGYAFNVLTPQFPQGAGLFTSLTGETWGAVGNPFYLGAASFIYAPGGILIPEGTALLTTAGLQEVGPAAPFTSEDIYYSFYAGPSPQPWLNLYP